MQEREGLEPVYIWDMVVRTTHWVVALSILLLAATGIYIGHPFLLPGKFVMGWAKAIHFYAAFAFTIAVLARIVWMFVGPRKVGWRQFIPASKRRRRDLLATLKFYLLIRPNPPRTIGHNPLAGMSYIGVFGLYFLMMLTGFALYSVSSYDFMKHFSFLVPLFHGLQWTRWIHHAGMWVILAFFVAHMFFSSLTSRMEKNGTIDSIFSGYKYMPKGQPPDDE